MDNQPVLEESQSSAPASVRPFDDVSAAGRSSQPAESLAAAPALKVAVLGLRGFPDVQGGIERHCEMLYPRLAERGVDVTVHVRSRYAPDVAARAGLPLRFVSAPTLYSAGLEATVHSILATLWCIATRPDVVHIHAIGPAICVPLARLGGLKVVVTHHGFDYDRQKWGRLARLVLRTGERMAGRYANRVIAISEGIRSSLASRFSIRPALIPNGVDIRTGGAKAAARRHPVLDSFDIPSYRYLISVGRWVPEKRQSDLIRAWSAMPASERAGWRLVIVGSADHESPYVTELKALARSTPDVVLTGLQTGAALDALWDHAGGFLLPSSHEGLPIVLLEAMSHALPVLASDIEPNLEVGLPENCYLRMGDVAVWSEAMRRLIGQAEAALSADGSTPVPVQPLRVAAFRSQVAEQYNWDRIADQTLAVYREVVAGR